MRAWFSLTMLLLLLSSCTTPPNGALRADENAVIAAVVKQEFGKDPGLLVLQAESRSFDPDWDRLREELPQLQEETLANYRAQNANTSLLQEFLDLPMEVVFLTESESKAIFEQGGWDAFYARFPKAHGLTALSRVGFNRERTQALVYMGTMSHYLAGAGFFYLLEKERGSWKVKGQLMVWIS